MLGEIEAGGEGGNRMRWLDSITDSMDMSKPLEIVKDRDTRHIAVNGISKSWTRLSD